MSALRSLPEATLFEEDSSISPIWLEVLERASKFLKSVVCGDINGGSIATGKCLRHAATIFFLTMMLEWLVSNLLSLWWMDSLFEALCSSPVTSSSTSIPTVDRHVALAMLFELALQVSQLSGINI